MIEPYDIQPNGAIWFWASDEDWLLGSDIDISRLPKLDKVYYYYNQWTLLGGKLRSFCTVMSPIQVLSSQFNYELDVDDFEDLREFARMEYWYKEGKGNYIKTGVECAVDRWNRRFPEHRVIYLRVNILDPLVKEVRAKGYGVCWGYKWDRSYNLDRDDNAVVNGVDFWFTYGHAVPLYKDTDGVQVHDSYKGRPTNVYGIQDLEWLRKNSVFYRSAYIIVPDPNAELEEEIRKKKELFDNIMMIMEEQNSLMRHQIENHPTATDQQKQEVKDATHKLNNAFRDIRG